MNPETGVNDEIVLIERIKQGERSGFDALVRLYQQKGLNIAYGLVGNIEDAKDILQEAFVKLYLNIAYFQARSKFYTWFYRIVVNCSLDFLRRKKRVFPLFVRAADDEGEGREIEIPDSRFEPAKMAMNKELGRTLDNCIASLPRMQKTCFVLRHQNGLSTHEIAQVLKCRPATVKVHIFRAMNNLRKKLSGFLA
ncbi:MAG: RNA polymerase sigma factor [Candidatus Omnitrophota bacterium]